MEAIHTLAKIWHGVVHRIYFSGGDVVTGGVVLTFVIFTFVNVHLRLDLNTQISSE